MIGMNISLDSAELREILVSHHPNCPCFKNDVVVVFGRRICAGCVFAYPTALLTLFLLKPTGIESVYLAIALAAASQLRRFIRNKVSGLFFRGLAGVALGFGLGGLIYSINTNNIGLVLLLILSAGVYAAARMHSMKKRLMAHRCNI